MDAKSGNKCYFWTPWKDADIWERIFKIAVLYAAILGGGGFTGLFIWILHEIVRNWR